MGKYVKGIIGGLLGGMIAAIPWVLMYVYGGFILSILATLIAFGVNYGYHKLKGPIDRKLPIIVTVSSIVIVILVTLVVIPLLLLYKDGFYASFENLQILYQSNDFFVSMMKDLVVSVIFTILGISGVIQSIKKEI